MSDATAHKGGDSAQSGAGSLKAPPKAPLSTLPSRSRTTGHKAAARSRLVRRLRIALPILAVVLVAAFLFNTQNQTVDQAFLDEFQDIAATTDELQMANPRFSGVDDKGKPFLITANAAKQASENKNIVELEMPRAVQGSEDDTTVVTAEKGVFESERNILELSEGVRLEHEIGNSVYVFRSPAATVNIRDEIVTSNAGVGGDGPNGGALKADRMTAYNGEQRIVFEGNVSMRIYPETDSDGNTLIAPPLLKDVEINETP